MTAIPMTPPLDTLPPPTGGLPLALVSAPAAQPPRPRPDVPTTPAGAGEVAIRALPPTAARSGPAAAQADAIDRSDAAATRSDATVRVLLVEELDRVAAHVSGLLRNDDRVQLLDTVSDGQTAIERIDRLQPDVVIVDALLQGKVNGAGVVRHMRTAGLRTPIILLTVPEHPVRLGDEMGLAEALTLPLEADELLASIVRLDDAHRGPAPVTPSGVFVVFSGKGGVGRTTIAHNLAVSLAGREGVRVALLDGGIAHGDLRLHLDAPDTAPSILQLPTGRVTEDDLQPVLWRDGAGVDVLLAPPRVEQADLITHRDVENALVALRRAYDVVVIDASSALDEVTLALLDRADVLLNVVTPERGALRKDRRCRAVLAAAGYPMQKVVTVLNRADGPAAGPEMAADIAGAIDARLPEEPRLAGGHLPDGGAIVAADADAPISRAFDGLAALLIERAGQRLDRPAARAA